MSEGDRILQTVADAESFTVSFRSIRKSGRVLYAFSQFYTPFHGLPIEWFFGHYAVFGCISAAIYEIDDIIEAGHSTAGALGGLTRLEAFLRAQLECDQQIAQLLDDARKYYQFEHGLLQHAKFEFEQVVNLTAKRSFDFRLMHRALFQLCGLEYDERVFAWFRQFEILMEIEDDVQSFQVDTAHGTFNILALANRACGCKTAPDLVEDHRRGVEAALSCQLDELTADQQKSARRVLADYRAIVSRPEIPRW